jgi:hypothetical protein
LVLKLKILNNYKKYRNKPRARSKNGAGERKRARETEYRLTGLETNQRESNYAEV